MSVEADRYRAFFRFRTSNQAENVAGRFHNRRACSALQGIGGWATNKQSAKSKTFAQLAGPWRTPQVDSGMAWPSDFSTTANIYVHLDVKSKEGSAAMMEEAFRMDE